MGYVSPHDNKTALFHAVIKKNVVLDFSGEDVIIAEQDDEYVIVMPLRPVDGPVGFTIGNFTELVEAQPCSVSGVLTPIHLLDEEGRSPECAVPDRLKEMSQEDMIRYILQLEKQAATPEEEAAPKKTTRRRGGAAAAAAAATAQEVAEEPVDEPAKESAEDTEAEGSNSEFPSELSEIEPIKAISTETELDVKF